MTWRQWPSGQRINSGVVIPGSSGANIRAKQAWYICRQKRWKATVFRCFFLAIWNISETRQQAYENIRTFWYWKKCNRQYCITMSTSSNISYITRWHIHRVIFLMPGCNRYSCFIASGNNWYKCGTMRQWVLSNNILRKGSVMSKR